MQISREKQSATYDNRHIHKGRTAEKFRNAVTGDCLCVCLCICLLICLPVSQCVHNRRGGMEGGMEGGTQLKSVKSLGTFQQSKDTSSLFRSRSHLNFSILALVYLYLYLTMTVAIAFRSKRWRAEKMGRDYHPQPLASLSLSLAQGDLSLLALSGLRPLCLAHLCFESNTQFRTQVRRRCFGGKQEGSSNVRSRERKYYTGNASLMGSAKQRNFTIMMHSIAQHSTVWHGTAG